MAKASKINSNPLEIKEELIKNELNMEIIIEDESLLNGYEDIQQNEQLECKFCNKSFRDTFLHKIHELRHTAGKHIIKCEICNKNYATMQSLRAHELRQHRIIAEKQSNIENDPLKTKEVKIIREIPLRANRNLDPDVVKPHKCKNCDRGFSSAFLLRRHSNVHLTKKKNMQKKKFKCEFCNRGYTRRYALKCHQKVHEDN